jgi:exopolyphosphatase/guanosine-5'-triphosphate,3'-diphosphate pyrophosphatase
MASEALTVAAIDLGSNSFHLAVYRVRPDRRLERLASAKSMLRLGEQVFAQGRFGAEALARAAATLAEFRRQAEAFGAERIAVRATAAFREADDGVEAVEWLEAETGLAISVISGHEEAALIFEAIRSACHLGSRPVLGADLGGGSLELMLGDQRQLIAARSLRVGVGRLRARFGPELEDRARVRAWLREVIGADLAAMAGYQPTRLILTSGTFGALAKLAIALDEGRSELDDAVLARRVRRGALVHAIELVCATPPQDRGLLPGIDEGRRDTIAAGALVLEQLLAIGDRDDIWWCQWALREGVVLTEADADPRFRFSFAPSELREGSVRELMRRYRVDESHARAVESLAVQLFSALAERLGLREEARELLAVAALLHEVGAFVATEGYERHGAYLLTAAPPLGFTLREARIVAGVVGGQVKGGVAIPEGLEEGEAAEVVALAALLRVADALDRSRQGVIRRLELREVPRGLEVCAVAAGETGAEEFAFRRRRKLLEDLVGRPLALALVGAVEVAS